MIRDKLAALDRFIHAVDGLDPLVKLALVHYQFEAIHPFPDGNGRTGRILKFCSWWNKACWGCRCCICRATSSTTRQPITKACAG